VHLNAAQLEALTAWIDKYRLIHEQQFRRLDALLQGIDLPGETPITTPTPITGLIDRAGQHKEEQT
jgi:hypothetical protein